MKKYIFYLILFLFIGCQKTNPPLTETQKAEIERQVMEQWDKLDACVEKSDAEGFMNFFSTNEFLGMYSGGTVFQKRNEYADTVKVWFGLRESNQIEGKKVSVNVLGNNLALLNQTSVFQANFKNKTIMKVNHAASFLFRKEDSGWKIIHGHESMKN